MLTRLVKPSRSSANPAVVATLIGSLALLVHEGLVVATAVVDSPSDGGVSSWVAKAPALGMIEAIDIFLIALMANLAGQGLYRRFVDPELKLPPWSHMRDLDDRKRHLATSIVAVTSVLFMRKRWPGTASAACCTSAAPSRS